MSDSGPAHPLPWPHAIALLCAQLDANVEGRGYEFGVACERKPLTAKIEPNPGAASIVADFGEEARREIRKLLVSGRLKAWTEDGDGWKRPTLSEIVSRLGPENAHGPGLFMDRSEFIHVLRGHMPPELQTEENSAIVSPTLKKKGRPKGPGYSLKDVEIYKRILAAQRAGGNVETRHALVRRFAHELNGNEATDIDRLRKGLPNWLDENGEKWSGAD